MSLDSQAFKVVKIFDEVTAGTSDSNGTEIDMKNWEWVKFVVVFGTSAADNGIKVQQDTATGMASAADLANTQVLLDATETTAIVDVIRPKERFVRAVAVRGTSTTVPAGVAILGGPRTCPFDQDAETDTAYEYHVSPDEGTA